MIEGEIKELIEKYNRVAEEKQVNDSNKKTKSNSKPDVRIYSVDELTEYIKDVLEQNKILQDILVKGEISNFKHSDKGHMYFSLKDENSIVGCAMFHRTNIDLEFKPEEGIKVLVRGRIEVYKKSGRYQIIVEEMSLAGKGELHLKFLQLKSKLEKEGLFKEEHKKPLPKYPKNIGVVTSLQGAVIHDIIKVIRRRYPHVRLVVYPSLVQGDEAKYTLVRGIETLNHLNIDVIIVARGGGSFEELWPFNEEIVAEAIFKSKIPIISAVGHEADFTIADFVADKRAPTPSAAAEIVVPNEQEILSLLIQLEKRLCKQTSKAIEIRKQKIQYLSTHLKQMIFNKMEISKREISGLRGKLDALNPKAVIKRGYSITLKEDKVVSSIKNIKAGDVLFTIIKDGKIESEVKHKNENKNI